MGTTVHKISIGYTVTPIGEGSNIFTGVLHYHKPELEGQPPSTKAIPPETQISAFRFDETHKDSVDLIFKKLGKLSNASYMTPMYIDFENKFILLCSSFDYTWEQGIQEMAKKGKEPLNTIEVLQLNPQPQQQQKQQAVGHQGSTHMQQAGQHPQQQQRGVGHQGSSQMQQAGQHPPPHQQQIHPRQQSRGPPAAPLSSQLWKVKAKTLASSSTGRSAPTVPPPTGSAPTVPPPPPTGSAPVPPPPHGKKKKSIPTLTLKGGRTLTLVRKFAKNIARDITGFVAYAHSQDVALLDFSSEHLVFAKGEGDKLKVKFLTCHFEPLEAGQKGEAQKMKNFRDAASVIRVSLFSSRADIPRDMDHFLCLCEGTQLPTTNFRYTLIEKHVSLWTPEMCASLIIFSLQQSRSLPTKCHLMRDWQQLMEMIRDHYNKDWQARILKEPLSPWHLLIWRTYQNGVLEYPSNSGYHLLKCVRDLITHMADYDNVRVNPKQGVPNKGIDTRDLYHIVELEFPDLVCKFQEFIHCHYGNLAENFKLLKELEMRRGR